MDFSLSFVGAIKFWGEVETTRKKGIKALDCHSILLLAVKFDRESQLCVAQAPFLGGHPRRRRRLRLRRW